MMRNHHGFFMTEFLLYLLLSACMGVYMMKYMYSTVLRLRSTTQETERIASIHAALDALSNDIEKAPNDITKWRMLTKTELVWEHDDTQQVGWKLQDTMLKRNSRNYDQKEARWKRTTSHVALEEVKEAEFVPHYADNKLDGITITISGVIASGKLYQVQRTIALFNRVMVI